MRPSLEPASIEAIAREVAALLERRAEPGQLLTAGQVAARFNVDRSWVYAHANELGVVRLTDSTRPRLRFDPAVVAQRLLAESSPVVPPGPSFVHRARSAPLLPIRGRTLAVDERPADMEG